MKKLVLIFIFIPLFTFAKRSAIPVIEPIEIEGIVYDIEYRSKGDPDTVIAYIDLFDANDKTMIKSIPLYKMINDRIPDCLHIIYISKIEHIDGFLEIYSESGAIYQLDLSSHLLLHVIKRGPLIIPVNE